MNEPQAPGPRRGRAKKDKSDDLVTDPLADQDLSDRGDDAPVELEAVAEHRPARQDTPSIPAPHPEDLDVYEGDHLVEWDYDEESEPELEYDEELEFEPDDGEADLAGRHLGPGREPRLATSPRHGPGHHDRPPHEHGPGPKKGPGKKAVGKKAPAKKAPGPRKHPGHPRHPSTGPGTRRPRHPSTGPGTRRPRHPSTDRSTAGADRGPNRILASGPALVWVSGPAPTSVSTSPWARAPAADGVDPVGAAAASAPVMSARRFCTCLPSAPCTATK
ncbi:hypothetical protein JMUB5695_03391 [Mycobacterium heckeshornense]|nr:hypothetical protein JMUB5695_03391 [Mycobacterium heckeshornense]